MIFNPRITKALSRVMLAKPLSLLSSRKVILISEISKILPLRSEPPQQAARLGRVLNPP